MPFFVFFQVLQDTANDISPALRADVWAAGSPIEAENAAYLL
jgi:hypothetical protein